MPTHSTRTIGIIRLDENYESRCRAEETDDLAATLRWLVGEKRAASPSPSPSRSDLQGRRQVSAACPPRITADLATISSELHDEFAQLTI